MDDVVVRGRGDSRDGRVAGVFACPSPCGIDKQGLRRAGVVPRGRANERDGDVLIPVCELHAVNRQGVAIGEPGAVVWGLPVAGYAGLAIAKPEPRRPRRDTGSRHQRTNAGVDALRNMGGVAREDDDVKTADTQLRRSERSPACGDRVVLVDMDKTGRAKEQGIQRRLSARVFGVDPRRKAGREDNGHDVLFVDGASETAKRVARPHVVRLKAILETVAVVRQVVADRGIAAAIALWLAVGAGHVLHI